MAYNIFIGDSLYHSVNGFAAHFNKTHDHDHLDPAASWWTPKFVGILMSMVLLIISILKI